MKCLVSAAPSIRASRMLIFSTSSALFQLVLVRCWYCVIAIDPVLQKGFSNVYRDLHWGSDAEGSGTGSTIESTRILQQELVELVERYDVRSMFDAPCGSFFWMPGPLAKIFINRPYFHYVGGDIVPDIIQRNKFKISESPSLDYSFIVHDITDPVPERFDLIIARDVFVHLTMNKVMCALKRFKDSGSKFLLVSSFDSEHENNDDVVGLNEGAFRGLNLQKAPFNFPPPIRAIKEAKSYFMGLWLLSSIPEFDCIDVGSMHTTDRALELTTMLQRYAAKAPAGLNTFKESITLAESAIFYERSVPDDYKNSKELVLLLNRTFHMLLCNYGNFSNILSTVVSGDEAVNLAPSEYWDIMTKTENVGRVVMIDRKLTTEQRVWAGVMNDQLYDTMFRVATPRLESLVLMNYHVSLSLLAKAWLINGVPSRAVQHLRKCESKGNLLLGYTNEFSMRYIQSLDMLAAALSELTRFHEAFPVFERGIALADAVLGPNQETFSWILINYGISLWSSASASGFVNPTVDIGRLVVAREKLTLGLAKIQFRKSINLAARIDEDYLIRGESALLKIKKIIENA